jgi:poly(A)-specific ribonuclease
MDVDKIAFPSRLLEILEALSECHFVSIDFEFSGVVSKPTVRQKQTLEERYAETKEAAEKYQILQVGLTCALHDDTKQGYILQPYNIPITPVFDEDLDLERQFSFQSGAMEFLLKNAFNFSVSFEDGVPYLSRDEEQIAKDKFKARSDKNRFEDIEIAGDDILTLNYLEKVRAEIKDWLGSGGSVEIVRCCVLKALSPPANLDNSYLALYTGRTVTTEAISQASTSASYTNSCVKSFLA